MSFIIIFGTLSFRTEVKGQRVRKIEWKRTDGRTGSVITWSHSTTRRSRLENDEPPIPAKLSVGGGERASERATGKALTRAAVAAATRRDQGRLFPLAI